MTGPRATTSAEQERRRMAAYVTALEIEVDRLRRHHRHVNDEVRAALQHARRLCLADGADGHADFREVAGAVDGVTALLRDLQDLPGYHPAFDQVIAVALRPLAEQIFRSQQRLFTAGRAVLDLELESEYLEWFPSRLRHILDNLISNALKYRDPAKEEVRVRLQFRHLPEGYELVLTDNGLGLGTADRDRAFDVLYRAAPARATAPGVGLAVVKLLIEQSDGTLTVSSGEGQGTTFRVLIPRYELDDFLI